MEIESHSLQPEGTERVAEAMAEELEPAGFECTRVPLSDPVGEIAWMGDLFLPGARYADLPPAVVARRAGTGPRVLLLGDLDTAYPEGSLQRFPFQVEGGRARGPGIADMKGGLAVLVEALEALERSGLESPQVCVVLSPDEQAGSLGSRAVIEHELPGTDYCFSMECAREGGKILTERAQCGVGAVEVVGREGHAGSSFEESLDAIAALAQVIGRVDRLSEPARRLIAVVTMIEGGRRRSVVAGRASCVVDIRAPSASTWAHLEEQIRREVEAGAAPCTAHLAVGSHRPAVSIVAGSTELRDVVLSAHRSQGELVGCTASAAGGSSAFAGGAGIPTIDGMGPVGGSLMTDHEYVDVGSLAERAGVLALVLHSLATSPPSIR